MVSPTSLEQITVLQTRMGWRHIPWFSLPDDTSSRDFNVNEYFGLNVFLRDDHDEAYRTYYVSARGVEPLLPTLSMHDLTPLGRQEDWEDTPTGRPQLPAYRAKRHDEYPAAPHWPSDTYRSSKRSQTTPPSRPPQEGVRSSRDLETTSIC